MNRICDFDENAIKIVLSLLKIICHRGQKQTGQPTSAENDTMTMASCFINTMTHRILSKRMEKMNRSTGIQLKFQKGPGGNRGIFTPNE